MVRRSSVVISLALLAWFASGCGGGMSHSARPSSVEESIDTLAQEIMEGLDSKQKRSIAVVGFSDENGGESRFGRFLAEELTTRLFRAGRFNVVERSMLDRIIAEQRLQHVSPLIDPSSAKEIGRILGVDAIASGTYTDLGDRLRVNARLIGTQDGVVFSAANVSVPRDGAVMHLLPGTASPAIGPGGAAVVPGGQHGAPEDVVYAENFSGVAEGTLPTRWVGGSNLIVAREGSRSFLRFFQHDTDNFTIPGIPFPADFRAEVRLRMGGSFSLTLGACKLVVTGYQIKINDTTVTMESLYKQEAIVSLEKRGDVFRGYVNGTQLVLARLAGYQSPQALSFKLETPYQWAQGTFPEVWRLYSISIRKL